MTKQKGFTLVEGLLIVLTLSVVGFAGYTVWNNGQEDEAEQAETAQQEAEQQAEETVNNKEQQNNEEEVQEPQSNTISVKHLSVELPGGWGQVEGAEKSTGAPEFYYEFSDGSGRTIGVSVNSGGFGGSGDGSITMSIEGNKILLSDKYEECSLDDQVGGCEIHKGDGELVLLGSTADRYDGNDYIIWFDDANSESQDAYKFLADIAETIELI